MERPGNLGLGVIPFQHLFQHPVHLALMLGIFHVDEIDDDDTAQVPQPQLAADRPGCFQIGLEDGLFQVTVPHERAGVDIDGGHGLGLVDDHITAGLELDLPPEYGFDVPHFQEYNASAKEGGFEAYFDKYIKGRSEAEYQQAVGGIDAIRQLPLPVY